uniref:Mitoguardin n=1 Tax=Strongyloides papillosus TaxID=174720 RepID=A0A0N5BZH4_STREA
MVQDLMSIFSKNSFQKIFFASAGVVGLISIYYFIQRKSKLKKGISLKSLENRENGTNDLESLCNLIDALEKIIADSVNIERESVELLVNVVQRLKGARNDLLQLFPESDFKKITRKRVLSRSGVNKIPYETGAGDGNIDVAGRFHRVPSGFSDMYSARQGTLSIFSDSDSYQSAIDNFDILRDEIEEMDMLDLDSNELAFYKEGLEIAKRGDIKYRKNRCDFVKVNDVEEFCAKIYCIRKAFTLLMSDESKKIWLIKSGRSILSGIIKQDGKDPADFFDAYDSMIEFLNQPNIEETVFVELLPRKVPELNLWDVLLDYIVLDAFDDLRKPPSAFMALIKNPFFSQSTKESSISTLIYSIVKAKKSRLQNPHGFISHFYDISLAISPSLAMGILGVASKEFVDLCNCFKEKVFLLIIEIFDSKVVKYTTVEDLANDIWNIFQKRLDELLNRVNSDLQLF